MIYFGGNMSLSENIKFMRLAMGISQVALSGALGVTKQCVSNWENDNILPSIEMLIRLADFFGVSTDELLGRASGTSVSLDGLSPDTQAHIRSIIKALKNA